MSLSHRLLRNVGLSLLLVLIFFVGLISFAANNRNSQRIRDIITRDEVALGGWYDVAELIAEAKDRVYDFRLGRSEVLAGAELLVSRAMVEVEVIRQASGDADEQANMNELVATATRFRDAIRAYGRTVWGKNGSVDPGDREAIEEDIIHLADRMVLLGRAGAAYVKDRIEEKHRSVLEHSALSQKMLSAVLLFATCVIVVLAIVLARALEKPIRMLVEGTRELASGKLGHRVEIAGGDEFGELAQSFNSMAEELRRSQNELITAKVFTDNIIRSMVNTLVIINRDGTIRSVNRAVCDLLGYAEEEIVGRPVALICSEGGNVLATMDELLRKGGASNLETTYLAKDGRKLRMLLSRSVIRNEGGGFLGLVCVGQDITMQSEAMRAGHLASIGELAAGVAHEINNPMNSIINFAQILIDEIDQGRPVSRGMLELVIREGDRISSIVRSLLSFAREGEKDKDLMSLDGIILETLALTEVQVRKDGIDLKVDIPPGLPFIRGHFQQLQQVFLNLINNARYALNKKFPGVHQDKLLIITAREERSDTGSSVEVAFLDYGTGIPAGIIDKVRNPFFSTKPTGLGTGLGLTISHGIITDHDGRLDIDSREGEYTKVTVVLPMAEDRREKREGAEA